MNSLCCDLLIEICSFVLDKERFSNLPHFLSLRTISKEYKQMIEKIFCNILLNVAEDVNHKVVKQLYDIVQNEDSFNTDGKPCVNLNEFLMRRPKIIVCDPCSLNFYDNHGNITDTHKTISVYYTSDGNNVYSLYLAKTISQVHSATINSNIDNSGVNVLHRDGLMLAGFLRYLGFTKFDIKYNDLIDIDLKYVLRYTINMRPLDFQ